MQSTLELPGIQDQESKIAPGLFWASWSLDLGCRGALKYFKAPGSPQIPLSILASPKILQEIRGDPLALKYVKAPWHKNPRCPEKSWSNVSFLILDAREL